MARFDNQARINDEKMFKEFDEFEAKVYQPFRLTYLTYAKSVWELGLYEKVPPLIKRTEPVPYTDMEPQMVALEKFMESPPPFVKEYFYKYDQEQEKQKSLHLIKHRFTKYDKIPRIPADCLICFIKKDFPNIEKHFPKPFPQTDCSYKRIKKYHFKEYQELHKQK